MEPSKHRIKIGKLATKIFFCYIFARPLVFKKNLLYMIISKELKEAISHLSPIEKDRLIFRLLKKDEILTERLMFELLREKTVDERRDDVQKVLEGHLFVSNKNFYSAAYLHLDVRTMSGIISHHVAVTKDKYGEAWLNLWMLNEILELNKKNLLYQRNNNDDKFFVGVISRTFKILLLINKLHEDFLYEFSDGLEKLGNLIAGNSYMMKTAINNALNVNWLVKNEIPENIVDIHKELRQNGFLR